MAKRGRPTKAEADRRRKLRDIGLTLRDVEAKQSDLEKELGQLQKTAAYLREWRDQVAAGGPP